MAQRTFEKLFLRESLCNSDCRTWCKAHVRYIPPTGVLLYTRRCTCVLPSISWYIVVLFFSSLSFDRIIQLTLSLYLTEATALHHSTELAGLKPSWCTSSATSSFLCYDVYQIRGFQHSSYHWCWDGANRGKSCMGAYISPCHGRKLVPYKFTFESSWHDAIQDVIVALLWDPLSSLLDLGVLVYMLNQSVVMNKVQIVHGSLTCYSLNERTCLLLLRMFCGVVSLFQLICVHPTNLGILEALSSVKND